MSSAPAIGEVFRVPRSKHAPKGALDMVRGAQEGLLLILQVPDATTDDAERLRLGLLDLVAGPHRFEALIDSLAPRLEPASEATLLQARRNAAVRAEMLREFGALTGPQVAELAGSRASNRSALAARWRKENRIVGVVLHDTVYFPAFQFDGHGRPLSVVGAVLEILSGRSLTDWEKALWFVTRTGWLGDRRPVDLLDTEPEAVVDAARREAGEIAG